MSIPFFSSRRIAWPFVISDYPFEIDTEAVNPVWNVAGHFTRPPSTVCDVLTAREWLFEFEFNAAAFNAEYGEDFPSDFSFSQSVSSGNWFTSILGVEETLNQGFEWDTQIKLFEHHINDPLEFVFISSIGLAGIRYFTIVDYLDELGNNLGYYTLDVSMYATIPVNARGLDGSHTWAAITIMSATVTKLIFGDPDPITTVYNLTPGCDYLGSPHLGGSGQGNGGAFSMARISIESHFD